MQTIRHSTLPNGQLVAYRSRADFDILVREFTDDSHGMYLEHGIRLNDGDCVFDVGANIGFFLMQLNRVLSHGRVFCFEPIPDIFEVLQLNATRHNHLNCTLHNIGLADSDGSATFTYFPRTSVASTMHQPLTADFRRHSRRFILQEIRSRGGLLGIAATLAPEWCWYPVTEILRRYFQYAQHVTCNLQSLSSVIQKYAVDRIDLLKIDTEGAEDKVLAGIHAKHWPLIGQAVVEVHSGVNGRQRVENLLLQHGFKVRGRQLMPGVEHLHVVYATRTGDLATTTEHSPSTS